MPRILQGRLHQWKVTTINARSENDRDQGTEGEVAASDHNGEYEATSDPRAQGRALSKTFFRVGDKSSWECRYALDMRLCFREIDGDDRAATPGGKSYVGQAHFIGSRKFSGILNPVG